MKKAVCLILILLPTICFSQSEQLQNKITIGVNYVHFKFKNYIKFSYPRLSAENHVTRSPSFKMLAEYIHVIKINKTDFVSCPLSLGYKLNYLLWFSENEWFTSTFKLYNSVRCVLLLDNQKNNTRHFIRYAPWIDVFITNHLGLNGEMVFGMNMHTTTALGIKYRL